MEFSILIPCFNYDLTTLLAQLVACKGISDGEIIILDDGSTDREIALRNRLSSEQFRMVSWHEQENKGRARSRNRLVELSRTDNLIFLDADTEIENIHFVENYKSHFNIKRIVCGGHYYQMEHPQDHLLLNWKYARLKECKPVKERIRTPYKSFISMNFYGHKSILLELGFPEFLAGWGHEDTLFGHMLAEKAFDILHINNEVLHKGLSDNAAFIEKQEEAIEQALEIKHRYPDFTYKLLDYQNFVQVFLNIFPSFLIQKFLRITRLLATKYSSPNALNAYKLLRIYNRLKENNIKLN